MADTRNDYGRPPTDRWGLPGVQYPTPNVEDLVIVEEVNLSAGAEPLIIGTPHKRSPSAKLVQCSIGKGDNNTRVFRCIYATTRSAQDAYNVLRKFVDESPTHPIYIRTYVELRSAFTPASKTLTSIVSLRLTAGGANYASAPTVTISGGGPGTGATAEAVVQNGAVVAMLLTAGGSGYTTATALVATIAGGGGGTGATAVATIQPATAILTHEESTPVQGELGSLFDTVTRVYETRPGPTLYTERSGKQGTIITTATTKVEAGTGASQARGFTLSTEVQDVSARDAVSVEVTQGTGGTASSGFPLETTSRVNGDGIEVFTDHFEALIGYNLPPIQQGSAAVADWRSIFIVIGARSSPGRETNDNKFVQIDYVRANLPPRHMAAARSFNEDAAAWPVFVRVSYERHATLNPNKRLVAPDTKADLPNNVVLTKETFEPAGEFQPGYDKATRTYHTLLSGSFGPPVFTYKTHSRGLLLRTLRKLVAPTTRPSATGGFHLSSRVTQQSTTLAELETVDMIRSVIVGGVPTDALPLGFPITTTQRRDPETGVLISTDRFLAVEPYDLPATETADVLQTQWFQVNAAGNEYNLDLAYSPPRYVIGARKSPADDESDNVLIESEYCQAPDAKVNERKIGFTFPGWFIVNPNTRVSNNYAGDHPPPWNVGAANPNGYTCVAPRTRLVTAKEYVTYTVGRTLTPLPEPYNIVTRGTGSRIFGGLIREKMAHGRITWYDYITINGIEVSVPVEDIDPSTPAYYDEHDILCVSSKEERWRGNIFRQTVVMVSELTALGDVMPTPTFRA